MALAVNCFAPGVRIFGNVTTNLCFADDTAPLAECEYNVQLAISKQKLSV